MGILEYYVKLHLLVRQKMHQTRCPGIDSEAVIENFRYDVSQIAISAPHLNNEGTRNHGDSAVTVAATTKDDLVVQPDTKANIGPNVSYLEHIIR